MPEQEETGIWIRTNAREGKDGILPGYDVVVEVAGDRRIVLTEDQAFAHARTLLRACAMAEYDHSVYMQMRSRFDHDHALSVVHDLQQARGPLWLPTLAGFAYIPGLARDETKTPMVQLRMDDEVVGLWDLDSARMHAFILIEAPQAAELDGVYLKVLTEVIGLEDKTARGVIGELVEFRPQYKLGDGEALVTPPGSGDAEG